VVSPAAVLAVFYAGIKRTVGLIIYAFFYYIFAKDILALSDIYKRLLINNRALKISISPCYLNGATHAQNYHPINGSYLLIHFC
jgi:hypothetical protein